MTMAWRYDTPRDVSPPGVQVPDKYLTTARVTRVSVTRVTLPAMDWILLIYRLPANDSRARVAIWRELRRSGAHHLQQSVVAVPATEAFMDDVARLREVLAGIGGQLTVLRAQA